MELALYCDIMCEELEWQLYRSQNQETKMSNYTIRLTRESTGWDELFMDVEAESLDEAIMKGTELKDIINQSGKEPPGVNYSTETSYISEWFFDDDDIFEVSE